MSELIPPPPCPNPNCGGRLAYPDMVLGYGGRYELTCKLCGRTTCGYSAQDVVDMWNCRADRWKPIETAPDYMDILITNGQFYAVAQYDSSDYAEGENPWTLRYSERHHDYVQVMWAPTHWMPLPPPPTTGDPE